MTITMSSAHSPSFPLLHLRHSSLSNPFLALPTSQLIPRSFRWFTYVTAHSPTLPFTLPTSQLMIQPFYRLSYVTWRAAYALRVQVRTFSKMLKAIWMTTKSQSEEKHTVKLDAIHGRFDGQMIHFDNKFSQFLHVAECCNVPWLFVNNNCNHIKKTTAVTQ